MQKLLEINNISKTFNTLNGEINAIMNSLLQLLVPQDVVNQPYLILFLVYLKKQMAQ